MILIALLGFLFLASPSVVLAHEMYVLRESEIVRLTEASSTNPFSSIALYMGETIIFITLLGILIFCATKISLSGKFGIKSISRYKKYTLIIAQLAAGLGLFASAASNSFLGPELSLENMLPAFALPIRLFLLAAAGAILSGYLRTQALVLLFILYFLSIFEYSAYMITYLSYIGLFLFILAQEGNKEFLSLHLPSIRVSNNFSVLRPYSFAILRIFFGVSLMFSSFFAKFLHSNLAIESVHLLQKTIPNSLDPLFFVFNAFIIESLIGLFFILGFLNRFSAGILLVFLTLSIFVFQESLWPHIILYGTGVIILFFGYDAYSLMKHVSSQKEPTL